MIFLLVLDLGFWMAGVITYDAGFKRLAVLLYVAMAVVAAVGVAMAIHPGVGR
jgi:hypothetical protein